MHPKHGIAGALPTSEACARCPGTARSGLRLVAGGAEARSGPRPTQGTPAVGATHAPRLDDRVDDACGSMGRGGGGMCQGDGHALCAPPAVRWHPLPHRGAHVARQARPAPSLGTYDAPPCAGSVDVWVGDGPARGAWGPVACPSGSRHDGPDRVVDISTPRAAEAAGLCAPREGATGRGGRGCRLCGSCPRRLMTAKHATEVFAMPHIRKLTHRTHRWDLVQQGPTSCS
jgi:hypothetical protein